MTQGTYNATRYQRQTLLENFGETGQQKLLSAKVLVIGAGGLGCPALQYLAAAGVGTIGIADHDTIALNNLHRQVLYQTGAIGKSKAKQAAIALQQLNPDICINVHELQLTNTTALPIIRDYDLVIDGTDNFASRYMINDACVLLNKPLIYGSISQFEGQVAIFNAADDNGQKANYRHLFPEPPAPGEVLNCAEAGVLGVLPGIIGCMQANEAIKLIAGIGQPLINQLLTYNALNNESFIFRLTASEPTTGPADEAAFLAMNYDWFCGTGISDIEEINGQQFQQWITEKELTIIDVREQNELPLVDTFAHRQLPLSILDTALDSIEGDTVVVFCQSGKRSLKAARMIRESFGDRKKVYSLRGGILSFLQ
jgi:molybdopterin/thiamine biosynthesis adenylyltransferase/rhodanese-related sulfurtransferase